MDGLIREISTEGGKNATSTAIDLIVDTFVKPKIEKWKNRPKEYFDLVNLISVYLKKSHEKYIYMHTIVFSKETKTLDELYVPLTIVKNGNRRDKIVIDDNAKNMFDKPSKKMVIDTAGMGKSTVVKFLAIRCIDKNIGVPFIIELRRLGKEQRIISYITEEMKLLENNFTEADINDIIKRGDFIFFFDGYDEIGEDKKTVVTENIRKFMIEADNNCFVLTSRDDDLLGCFTGFEKYHIKPLSKTEAYMLISKYDNYGETSKELISAIESNKNYEMLEEFLSNPLMVSLLYLSYQYKGVLHYKKHTFYRQVYDALFEKHDCFKGTNAVHFKHSNLDIDEFKQILDAMGFFAVKEGEIEYTRDELNDLIKKAKKLYSNINFSVKDFFYDILHAVPLFVEEGLKYKWAHKSFSEYFAADFICYEFKEKEGKILKSILDADNNQKYYNILDFIYDMDYKGIMEYIVKPLLEEYIETFQTSYTDSKYSFMESDILAVRKFYEFVDKITFVKIDKNQILKGKEDIREYVSAFEEYKKSGEDSFSFVIQKSKSDKIFVFATRKGVYEIVKLLFRKNVDIFTEIKMQDYPMKFYKELKVGYYNVDDNPENILNNPNNFKAVTSCIYHCNYDFNGKILDYRKCCAFLDELNGQTKTCSDDIFIFE